MNDVGSPGLSVRAASDAGMVGRAGGWNDQKRESGKMGGRGIVTLAFLFYSSVSIGMGRLLEFS